MSRDWCFGRMDRVVAVLYNVCRARNQRDVGQLPEYKGLPSIVGTKLSRNLWGTRAAPPHVDLIAHNIHRSLTLLDQSGSLMTSIAGDAYLGL